MRAFDFTPLLRSSIGFENLNQLAEFTSRGDGVDNGYPPYNIEKLGDDAYRISMAVAGFARSELDIVVHGNRLVVAGKAAEPREPDERQFIHRGIARRGFERRFELADTIKVTSAAFENGLLNIDLVREVPEHAKPRRISIGDPEGQLIEGRRVTAA